jgi:hypothetical protein
MSESSRSKIGPALREVAILVAGILIAFGLDAWWDNSLERSEVEAELAGVLAELSLNEDLVEQYLRWHDRSRAATDELLRLLREEGSGSVAVPDSIVWGVGFTPTFDPRKGAMDALLSSGRLALIGDPELRSAIAGFGGQLSDARDEEIRAREYVDLQLGTVLHRSGAVDRAMSVNWRDGPVTEEQRRLKTPILRSQELVNHLARRRLFAILSMESLNGVSREIEWLRTRIQSYE